VETKLEKIYRYVDEHTIEFIKDLRSYLKQPSISAIGEGIKECAEMTSGFLKELGADVTIVSYDGGYPIVYGILGSNKAAKTLIHYNMYDTQPVGPIEKWISPPLDANVVNIPNYGDCIIARGAINTKGPLLAFLNALKSIQHTSGELPVNIIFVFEGEEEIGSPSLPKFIKEYANELKVASDAYMHLGSELFKPGVPAIFLGFKGWLPIEFEAKVREEDTHSHFKPIIDNAAWRLIWALNSLSDSRDQVIVEGFFDDVVPPSEDEMQLLKDLAKRLDEKQLKALAGRPRKWRKDLHGLELLKAYCFEPTINISGLISGYTETKIQNITPARALAKVDVRLVPKMSVDDILTKIKKHLSKRGFADVEVRRISGVGAYPWAKISVNAGIVQALIRTYKRMGYEPEVWPFVGGSAPGYLWMRPPLNLPTFPVIGGLGHGGNQHAPNEYFTVKGYRDSMKSAATFLFEYAKA